jgi:hypothetical protein
MSKYVGVQIIQGRTVVIYTVVILIVRLLVVIKTIKDARCMY